MLDVKNILFLVWLNVSMSTMIFCMNQKSKINNERKTMNNHNDQKTNSAWTDHIKKEIQSKNGQFQTEDNIKNSITLRWELIDPTSSNLNEAIKNSSEILVQMYTSMELQFARKHPEAVGSEMFLKPISAMFENGVENVDWTTATTKLSESLRHFLTTTDFAKYGNTHDVQIFVTAYDTKSGKQLGIIQFLAMPQFEYGAVKVAFFGVDEFSQSQGIEQILLSSIFKLIPDLSRIFLHTRISNETILKLYESIGFAKFAGPLPFWIDMEYLSEKSNFLQKTAESLKK